MFSNFCEDIFKKLYQKRDIKVFFIKKIYQANITIPPMRPETTSPIIPYNNRTSRTGKPLRYEGEVGSRQVSPGEVRVYLINDTDTFFQFTPCLLITVFNTQISVSYK